MVFNLPILSKVLQEHDLGYMTASWFESFPAALPQSIRDRLVSQLEEFVVDPIVAISLEIAVVFVGVVEPGTGIISAEAADDTTFTFDVTLHGFDAAIDVAADVEEGGSRRVCICWGSRGRSDHKRRGNYRCCYRYRR